MQEWPESARLALSGLLLLSAATLAFSLMPLLLSSAHVPLRLLWALSSGLHAAWLFGVLVHRVRQSLAIEGSATWNVIPAGIATALQAANAIYIQDAWPYLTAIVLLLLVGFMIFAVLLRSLGSAAFDEGDDVEPSKS
jgi:ABC-type uncharacterized transport system permease subunit